MGDSRAFGNQGPHKGHLVRGTGGLQGEVQDLRNDTDEGFIAMEAEVAGAAQSQAGVDLTAQPTEGDLLNIGGDVYEFVDTAGAGVEAGALEVLTGANAGEARDNIISAINGNAQTERIVASVYNTVWLHIKAANRSGGDPVLGPGPDIALGATLTSTNEWDHLNMSATGCQSPIKKTMACVVVDATNLAADFTLQVPFSPTAATVVAVTDASDVPDTTGKAASIILTVNMALGSITVDLDGGATDPVATDKVYIEITGL